jgi:hypothetical protein
LKLYACTGSDCVLGWLVYLVSKWLKCILWYNGHMPKRWTAQEEKQKRAELVQLYVQDNLSIREIADQLGMSQGGVYDRLQRLGLPSLRVHKTGCNNVRQDIVVPRAYSIALAELVGALLGDGNITPTQVVMTIGKKDKYKQHIAVLMEKALGVRPSVCWSSRGDLSVYVGSTRLVRWFLDMGLVFNKVANQVGVPKWIMTSSSYMRAALRGLWDTDGSVYKLKFGCQMGFRNRSRPLLHDVREMLLKLGFHPSSVSGYSVYLTRRDELIRFAREVGFGNGKHLERFREFVLSRDMQVD